MLKKFTVTNVYYFPICVFLLCHSIFAPFANHITKNSYIKMTKLADRKARAKLKNHRIHRTVIELQDGKEYCVLRCSVDK